MARYTRWSTKPFRLRVVVGDAGARSSSGNARPPTRSGVCTHPLSPLLRGSARRWVPPFGNAAHLTVAAAASPASGISPTWWQHRRFGVVHPPGKRPAARRVGTCWPWLPSARCFSVCGRQLPVPRPLARCKLARVARQSSSQCGGEQVQLLRRNSDSRCARHNYHLNPPRWGSGGSRPCSSNPPCPPFPLCACLLAPPIATAMYATTTAASAAVAALAMAAATHVAADASAVSSAALDTRHHPRRCHRRRCHQRRHLHNF